MHQQGLTFSREDLFDTAYSALIHIFEQMSKSFESDHCKFPAYLNTP